MPWFQYPPVFHWTSSFDTSIPSYEIIRASNAASCLANRRPPNVGKFMLRMTEITEKKKVEDWRTCKSGQEDIILWGWLAGSWTGGIRFNLFRADIHSRKRMTASHRDLKIKTFLSWIADAGWWLMMLESSIIFNMMNANTGGAPLHILMTLKITNSKLFTNPVALNNHHLRGQTCGSYLWVLCPQTSLHSPDIDI